MASRSISGLNLIPWFYLIYCLYFPTNSLKLDDAGIGAINSNNSTQNLLDEEPPVFYQGVYGKPGVDFPVLSHIPKTSFNCREMESGYYADLETDCQVFHICEEGKKISFLCPNGTIFEQSELICEWWFKVNCTNSPNLYEESAEQLREDNARRKASRRVYSNGDNHGAIMRTEQHSTVTTLQKGRNFEVVSTSSTNQNQQYARKIDHPIEDKPKEIKVEHKTRFGESPQFVNIGANGKTKPRDQNQYVNIRANSVATRKKVDQNQNIRLTVSTRLSGTLNGNQADTKTPQQNQNSITNNRQGKKIDLTVDKPNENFGTSSIIYGRKKEPNQANTNQINSGPKDSTTKQNSASYEPNRIANEPTESEESQIPQESSSFYKNSFNSIQQSYKPAVHPNHRETYSEIKEPQYYSTKTSSTLSSVTPQYLTTQPINNGRPFIGSQVGTTFNVQRSTTPPVTVSSTTASTGFFKSAQTTKFLPSVTPNPLSTPIHNIPLDLEAPNVNSFNFNHNKLVPSTTVQPIEGSTRKTFDHATVYGKFASSVTPPVFTTTPVAITSKILHSKPSDQSVSKSYITTVSPQNSGFYLTKNSSFRSDGYSSVSTNGYITTTTPTPTPLPDEYGNFKFTNEVQRPRPFKLSTSGASYLPHVTTQMTEKTTPTPIPSYPIYKVSSASPFSKTAKDDTVTTTQSTLPSTFENVDTMISALVEMAQNKERFAESTRPGLVVPPSAGPQTLHTLAVYFANALDGLAEEKEQDADDTVDADDDEDLTQTELEKKRLTTLLTQMTMDRYNELFNDNKDDIEETTTVINRADDDDDDSDLEGAHTKSAVPNPKVRQLAKVFTQALSSYLDDPVTFRRVLAEVRPTEPPSRDTDEAPLEPEDELLNFSDADVKSSFPPVFPTPPSIQPTWGYLIAYNKTNNLDIGRNSLNPEQENLQLADSQSFVSQFNRLQVDEKNQETTTRSSALPNNHWTRSPDATKLWKTAFTFNPAAINENFESTTESVAFTSKSTAESEEDTDIGSLPASLSPPLEPPHHEIKYELRALPRLALNSTQVHGILIDFMNNTKSEDDNRLQRILRKLNTTEDEFLLKMKEIETNPLTRRLILLLISECGANATDEIETQAVPIHDLISRNVRNRHEILEPASTNGAAKIPQNYHSRHENNNNHNKNNSNLKEIVDPNLHEEDARALQLLNSLYTIASKFGK